MSLLTVVILGIGIILIYSAITGTMPKDVVLKAFGKEN
jgi:hypothetical protein